MTAVSSSMLQVQQQRQQQELPSSTTTTTNGGDTTPQTDDSSSSTGGAALKKGPWTSSEDAILIDYVKKHGEGNWNAVQKNSGLSRCGKSCRLRWANHLRPNLKKGSFSPEEERLILQLHAKLGNKWARMAAQLPGRTDNEIKNYWNTRIKRRQRAGLPLYPADIQRQATAAAAVLRHSSATTRSKPLFESLKLSPSLSFFDPLSHSSHFSTTPLLNQTPTFMPSPIHHQFKRFKEPPPFNFQQNPYSDFPSFSSNNFQLHQQQQQPLVFNDSNNGGLDLVVGRGGVPYKPPDPVHRGGLPPQSAAFSVKTELPSSQFAESVSSNTGSGAPIFDINDDTTPATDMPFSSSNLLQRNNSGLLDALLQEAEAMAGGSEGVGGGDQKSAMLPECVAEKCRFDGWAQDDDPSHLLEDSIHWDDSISAHSSLGIKMKRESVEDGESVDEDFSALLDFMTPSMLPVSESECFIGDRAEMSNGEQSSAMIEDDVVKHEIQQPLSLSPADQVWDLGACPWNNMPGIC